MSTTDADSRITREEQMRNAARKLSQKILCAKHGDRILPVFDRFGQEVADGFLEAALLLNQHLTAVYVPVNAQEAISGLSDWSALVELIRSSTAIVTAVSDGHASTGFRVALLDTAMRHRLRAVHMPGVGEDVFLASALRIDFQELHLNATRVANTLTAAGKASVHTISARTGEAHCLNLSLHGR